MLASLNMLAGKLSPNSDAAPNISDNNNGDDYPDDDAIKMFVGQVPRSMDEEALKDFFEQFGPVHQLNVLRDKATGVSRGCCFVTFYKRKHALDAQNDLHNVKTMPGMHHPIQMKPADTENRNERKLFIGMVCKKLNEEDIKDMFIQFGPIEECTVLRDDNGISRGCAFVTFSNRQMAIVAIKAMHHSLTMEGCSSPMVVKFADTQKEKEQKKVQQIQSNLWGVASVNSPSLVGQTPVVDGLLGSPLTIGTQGILPQHNNYNLVALQQQLISLQQQQQQQQLFGSAGLSNFSQPLTIGQPFMSYQTTATAPLFDTQNFATQDLTQYRALSYAQPAVQQGSIPLSISPYLSLGQSSFPLATPTTSQQTSTPSAIMHTLSNQTNQGENMGGGKIKTPDGTYKASSGPEGANLFIYHLPQEFSDSDLTQTFQPFGTIVSAKVFIDKQTNLSKCFGFVSYTTNESAHSAIQAMNGFQIGNKRLKVQLKRPKDAAKPY